jgi:hypothetical protein
MKKPTAAQIKKEADKLKEMKPKIKQFSFFGDDNHEQIEAQIRVLREALDEDEIEDLWSADDNYNVNEAARNAYDWMNGTNSDIKSLVDDWSSLIQ